METLVRNSKIPLIIKIEIESHKGNSSLNNPLKSIRFYHQRKGLMVHNLKINSKFKKKNTLKYVEQIFNITEAS